MEKQYIKLWKGYMVKRKLKDGHTVKVTIEKIFDYPTAEQLVEENLI